MPPGPRHCRKWSRGNTDFSNQILSAMRREFGGHIEKTSEELK
jgi:6-phosphogluconate dehydrogenase (decarboxylating)